MFSKIRHRQDHLHHALYLYFICYIYIYPYIHDDILYTYMYDTYTYDDMNKWCIYSYIRTYTAYVFYMSFITVGVHQRVNGVSPTTEVELGGPDNTVLKSSSPGRDGGVSGGWMDVLTVDDQLMIYIHTTPMYPTIWLAIRDGKNMFFWNFHPDPNLGKWSKLANIFQMGWFNH